MSGLEVVRGVTMSLAALGTVAAGALIGLARPRAPRTVFFVVAAATQGLAWAGAASGRHELAALALFPTVLAIVVAPSLEVRGGMRSAIVALAIIYLVARAAVRTTGFSPLVILELPAAIAIAVLVSVGARDRRRWVETAFFAQSIAIAAFLAFAGDAAVHLQDTLLTPAAFHFEATVLFFAVLRTLRTSRIGFLLATAAAHALCWSMAILGLRGMPRRYLSWLPEFGPLQTCVTVAGVAFFLAMILVFVLPDKATRASA